VTRHTERREVAKLRAFTRIAMAIRELVRSGSDTTEALKHIAMRFRVEMWRVRQVQAAIHRKEARLAKAANDTPTANGDSYLGTVTGLDFERGIVTIDSAPKGEP
jgi:hypothetical protein